MIHGGRRVRPVADDDCAAGDLIVQVDGGAAARHAGIRDDLPLRSDPPDGLGLGFRVTELKFVEV